MPCTLVSERSLSLAAYTLPSKVPAEVSITRSAEYSTVGAGRPARCAEVAKAMMQRAETRAKRVNMGFSRKEVSEVCGPAVRTRLDSHGGRAFRRSDRGLTVSSEKRPKISS